VVARVAVVLVVEEAEELARRRRGKVLARRDEEGQPVAAHRHVLGGDGEHEGRRERPGGAVLRRRRRRRLVVEAERRRVERVALQLGRDVGEHELAVRLDHGHAVQVEPRAGEAVVDEQAVTAAGGCWHRRVAEAMEMADEQDKEGYAGKHRSFVTWSRLASNLSFVPWR